MSPPNHTTKAPDQPRDRGATIQTEIYQSLNVLNLEQAVVEIRAFKGWETVSGYYNDHEALAREAAKLDKQGYAFYVTLNPVNEALLAKATNQIKDYPKVTTSDDDITWRRWLLVDVDPVRPASVCATLGEKTAAYHKTKDVRDHLRGEGWPEPVIADSGNGFHLLYRVELPNDEANRQLVKGVLRALASEFGDDSAKIDAAVHNAARLVRLYGTANRKGVHTDERPHRRSMILKVADEEVQ